MSIYIYAQDADDFECMGLCGALVPSSCEHEERAGGLSELVLEHPIDDLGRFSCIQPGAVLKAPVPVRTTPEIDGGQVVQSFERWAVKSTASKAERYLWTKAVKGKKKALLPVGLSLVVSRKSGERYRCKSGRFGTGWVLASALSMQIIETAPSGTAGIERIEPAVSVRDQLFRIYEVEKTDRGLTAKARHISYDLLGNLTDYQHDQPSAYEALAGIMAGCREQHDFAAYTDMADKRTDVCYERTNPIKALLDPESGFLARWDAQLVRDDMELYLLKRAGLDRGVRIEYGKNLLGVSCTVSHDALVTGILPLGEDIDGEPLTMDEPILLSQRAREYPFPRIQVLPVAEAKVTKSVGAPLAKQRLLEAAQAALAAGVDLPRASLSVDFVRLGDAMGYEQFRSLEDVFLYDNVTISHKPLGIELESQVVQVRFDCLRRRYLGIELGSLASALTSGSLASWQIPSGISGGKLLMGSISSGALMPGLISTRHLQAECITAEQIQAQALYAQKIVAAVSELVSANIEKAQLGEAQIDWAQITDLNALVARVAEAQITTVSIQRAQINWAEIASLSARIAELSRAQITTANIEQADIRWAEIASLQTSVGSIVQASIGSADIDYANIKDMALGTAIISEGIGGRLSISRLAVTEANMVSLTTGELVLRGADGLLYALGVDEDGHVTTTPKSITGQEIDDDTIGGEKLIEGSITAREIDVGSLFADQAMVGTVKAANIDVADLFASSASFGRVSANHLTSDIGASLDLRSNLSIRQLVDDSYLELDDGGVTIGSKDDASHFRVRIEPDQVAVLQDGAPIASFQGSRIVATEAQLSRIWLGDWILEIGRDGKLSLAHS